MVSYIQYHHIIKINIVFIVFMFMQFEDPTGGQTICMVKEWRCCEPIHGDDTWLLW